MNSLLSIATRIDAATQLLRCIHGELSPGHGLITDAAARGLGICSEAVRLAGGEGRAMSAALSQEVAIARVDPERMDDLIDNYVICHLGGVMAAVRILECIYQEDDDSAARNVGVALYECLHWVEVARHQLGELNHHRHVPLAA